MDKEAEERVGFVEFSKFHFIINGGFLNETARSLQPRGSIPAESVKSRHVPTSRH